MKFLILSSESCSPEPHSGFGRRPAADPMSWSFSASGSVTRDFCTRVRAAAREDEDTSGIGSMTTTTHLSAGTCSAASAFPIKPKHRALVFQKARELSAAHAQSPSASAAAPGLPGPPQQGVRLSLKSADGVPIVAQVPKQRVTFREFRKFLSISSKSKKK